MDSEHKRAEALKSEIQDANTDTATLKAMWNPLRDSRLTVQSLKCIPPLERGEDDVHPPE